MKSADASGARVALIAGDRDLEQGTVMVKDLLSGDQQAVPLAAVPAAISEILGRPADA